MKFLVILTLFLGFVCFLCAQDTDKKDIPTLINNTREDLSCPDFFQLEESQCFYSLAII
ncbi:MAG: hypothetical protein QM763_18680 [Agriterribacter sp.]